MRVNLRAFGRGYSRHVLTAAALLMTSWSVLPVGAASAAPDCDFQLGFKAIADQIPAIVGPCLENESFNLANGNAEQRTAAHHGKGGLLVWRKADNWTAFTDGSSTWVNGPNGLQKRLNSERFSWEADASAYAAVDAAPAAPPEPAAPAQPPPASEPAAP